MRLLILGVLIAVLSSCTGQRPTPEIVATSESAPPAEEPLDPSLSGAALYQLGVMQFEGRDGTKNEAEGVKNWQAAADLGYAPAQVALGWSYDTARGGLRRDPRKTRDLYLQAAKQDYIPALLEMGHLYFSGQSPAVGRNDREAARMFRRAAELGNGHGKFMIGWMLRAGRGVPQDHAAAAKFLTEAADLGSPEAMNELGYLNANGLGVPKDDTRASALFRKAAELGNRIAMYNLAINLREGLGVPRDQREAARWFEAAALKGHQGAAFQMGRIYERGEGLDKNPAKAAEWFRIAAGLKTIDDAPTMPSGK